MQTLSSAQKDAVLRSLSRFRSQPGPLLEILHDIQDALGFVPEGAVPLLAEGLNLSRAEVHGVMSFYPHLRTHPPSRHTVRVCRAEACQSMGADALLAHARQALGVALHGTTSDGAISLEPVYCLGNCACSPAMMIDGAPHGRVTPERFDALIAALHEADRNADDFAGTGACRSLRLDDQQREKRG